MAVHNRVSGEGTSGPFPSADSFAADVTVFQCVLVCSAFLILQTLNSTF